MNYSYIHEWMRKTYGVADRCEKCLLDKPIDGRVRSFAWANLSGRYKKDRSDWKMMCYSCHKKYDMKRLGIEVWNKGRKTGLSTPASFKKGCTPWNKGKKTGQVPRTAFRAGNTPWNKELYLKKEGL